MPWVEKMKTTMTELKSSNWIAQETRSQAANGNQLEIWNLQDMTTCQFLFQNLMISAIEQQNYFNFILNNKWMHASNSKWSKNHPWIETFPVLQQWFHQQNCHISIFGVFDQILSPNSNQTHVLLFVLTFNFWRNKNLKKQIFQSKNSSKWRKKKP